MAKDPAFLFYSQDFYTGVATMSFEDRGKYISILCLMHQQGRMTEETIRFIVGSVSDMLRAKFSVDDKGFWFNDRLEAEIQKRTEFTESRRNNGSKGGRPKASAKPNGKPKSNHMENEIENDNENGIDNKKESAPAPGAPFILVDEEPVFDVVKLLEMREAALNGRCSEHKLPPWRTLVPPWLNQNVGGFFKDTNHVFNAFSKHIILTNEQRAKTKRGTGQNPPSGNGQPRQSWKNAWE